ncbi:Carbamoyl-phosphate synthase small chain [Labeo rohita]|uniref:Carbamoyl-phosphate synthase small chain n=1 Tax=Labeo rohita TaxID=84645 RepID=A0ABQ8M2K2_LABRO|nr:Carbamoyl-phosphate synthase small chain [Labeo rohita]
MFDNKVREETRNVTRDPLSQLPSSITLHRDRRSARLATRSPQRRGLTSLPPVRLPVSSPASSYHLTMPIYPPHGNPAQDPALERWVAAAGINEPRSRPSSHRSKTSLAPRFCSIFHRGSSGRSAACSQASSSRSSR